MPRRYNRICVVAFVDYISNNPLKHMNIDSADLLPMLIEFSSLTEYHRRVFLYCFRHLSNPVAYTGDLQRIAIATSLHPQTVQRALKSINRTKILSRSVHYTRINHKEAFFYEQFSQQTQHDMGGDSLPAG